MSKITRAVDQVRDVLHEVGKNMTPAEWKGLLEELGADIDGHLDAIREESENE